MFLRFLPFIVFILSAFLGPREASCAEPRKPTEYEVKAAYIFNFAKFVEWPPGKSQGAGAPMNVCVVGRDPFGSALEAIEGKVVGGRRIQVRRNPPPQTPGGCAILFVSGSESQQLGRILENLDNSNVLTIGDTEGFAEKGVMINFFMEEKRVRFEINPRAAGRAGLRISSNLLKLARIVGTP